MVNLVGSTIKDSSKDWINLTQFSIRVVRVALLVVRSNIKFIWKGSFDEATGKINKPLGHLLVGIIRSLGPLMPSLFLPVIKFLWTFCESVTSCLGMRSSFKFTNGGTQSIFYFSHEYHNTGGHHERYTECCPLVVDPKTLLILLVSFGFSCHVPCKKVFHSGSISHLLNSSIVCDTLCTAEDQSSNFDAVLLSVCGT